jgi:photosystem II stability/assembly factor-like uncharacterized protein
LKAAHALVVLSFIVVLAVSLACESDESRLDKAASAEATPTVPITREEWIRSTTMPEEVKRLNDVVCTGPNRCVASGQSRDTRGVLLLTTDGGMTWNVTLISPQVNAVETLACRSAGFCIASTSPLFGPDIVYLSHDEGNSWTLVELEDGTYVDSPSCGESFCMAIGMYGHEPSLLRSTDGTTWVQIPDTRVLAEQTQNLACDVSLACWLSLGEV